MEREPFYGVVMGRREQWARPAWWPQWVPRFDEAGHELLPGRVSVHRCDCAGAEHEVWRCAANECRTVYTAPGCVGLDVRS